MYTNHKYLHTLSIYYIYSIVVVVVVVVVSIGNRGVKKWQKQM